MIYIWLNILPIALATLAGLALGLLYARRARVPLRPGFAVLATLAIFWFAAILAGALILAPNEAPPWVMAVGTAVVIWAGFVLPAVTVSQLFRGARTSRALADALWWLAAMVAMAVVLKLWGLVPPPG